MEKYSVITRSYSAEGHDEEDPLKIRKLSKIAKKIKNVAR